MIYLFRQLLLDPVLRPSKCVHCYPLFSTFKYHSPLSSAAFLAMQVISYPDSSPAKIPSPLFLRSIQITDDEDAISMFLNPDLNENDAHSKRVGIYALPSIAASPIGTPTANLSLQFHNESTSSSVTPVVDDTTTIMMSITSPPLTPTWIATPPTPPYKNMRRCNTVTTRRSSLTLFTPSTSFPTSAAMCGGYAKNSINTGLKRCTSVPSISEASRVQTISEPLLSKIDGRLVLNSLKSYSATISIVDEESDPAGSSSHPSSVQVTENDGSCLPEVTSPEGSWSDHSVEGFWDTPEKSRDALRKFHALKELLATEVGYLKDLRALVTVTIFTLVHVTRTFG